MKARAERAIWPPVAALLNLTGLGLGYLYMRRWLRWLIHLLVTAALIATAFLRNAAHSPTLWAIVLGLWLLWMAWDGWRYARRLAQTGAMGVAGRRRLSLVLALLLVGLEAAGLWGYVLLGQREFEAGMSAYATADLETAVQHFHRVTTLYELTLSPNVAAADAHIVECSLLISAKNTRMRGGYADAVEEYESYLDRYPDSILIPLVRDAVAETYSECASHFRQVEDYAAAIEQYHMLLGDYPQAGIAGHAAATAAETYAAWAAQLQEDGVYGEAVEKYLIILDEYPDTPTAEEGATLATDAYGEWAAHLREMREYEEAIETYQIIFGEYPNMPAAAEARRSAAETYAEWATRFRRAGDHEGAIERYQIILGEYSDTPAAAEARKSVAETYAEWAARFRRHGEHDEAIARYQIISDQYPNTSAAEEAEELAVETYGEWAAQLRQAGNYRDAIDKYHIISDEYPNSVAATRTADRVIETCIEWAAQLREDGQYRTAITRYDTVLTEYPDDPITSTMEVELGRTYNEWGHQLHSDGQYLMAMKRFAQAKESTEDPDVIADAEEGHDEAVRGLSQDTGGEGETVMKHALADACDGNPASSPAVGLAEDEPGKALFAGSEFALSSAMKATSPGHFRYAVCLEAGKSVVQRCPYTGGHTLVRERRWWRVRVRDPRTARVVADRTFYGSLPNPCPYSRSFLFTVDYSYGPQPSADDVTEWLGVIVR